MAIISNDMWITAAAETENPILIAEFLLPIPPIILSTSE